MCDVQFEFAEILRSKLKSRISFRKQDGLFFDSLYPLEIVVKFSFHLDPVINIRIIINHRIESGAEPGMGGAVIPVVYILIIPVLII